MESEILQDKKIADTGYGMNSSCGDHVSLDREWYALYVKSRHEFVTKADLECRGIEAYLPAVKRLRQWKDRQKFVEFPLFPGYLFVFIRPDPEEYLRVLKARGAVTFISLEPGYPSRVSSGEIQALKMLIESGEELDIYPHLKEGEKVRVKKGSLRGAEGVLKRREEQYIFLVNIDLLGRSVGVRMHADDIEAA
ncbi:transcriptional activator RfaH [bacterium BMS3Abin07]|nr:transcriptional activator RfaH [bacterium BMS3Abin07]